MCYSLTGGEIMRERGREWEEISGAYHTEFSVMQMFENSSI